LGAVKKTISVRVQKELWESFHDFVFKKYGSLYGSVSEELETALKNWLAAHTNFTNKPNKLNPLGSPSERSAKEIISWIQTRIETFQAPKGLIIKAIEETRGSDPRTIKKWLSYLHKHGHIKPLGGEIWELL